MVHSRNIQNDEIPISLATILHTLNPIKIMENFPQVADWSPKQHEGKRCKACV